MIGMSSHTATTTVSSQLPEMQGELHMAPATLDEKDINGLQHPSTTAKDGREVDESTPDVKAGLAKVERSLAQLSAVIAEMQAILSNVPPEQKEEIEAKLSELLTAKGILNNAAMSNDPMVINSALATVNTTLINEGLEEDLSDELSNDDNERFMIEEIIDETPDVELKTWNTLSAAANEYIEPSIINMQNTMLDEDVQQVFKEAIASDVPVEDIGGMLMYHAVEALTEEQRTTLQDMFGEEYSLENLAQYIVDLETNGTLSEHNACEALEKYAQSKDAESTIDVSAEKQIAALTALQQNIVIGQGILTRINREHMLDVEAEIVPPQEQKIPETATLQAPAHDGVVAAQELQRGGNA